MALVMTTSCSDNGKMKALLEQIPENTEVVCVGNVKTILESAGGSIEDSKIKLPSYVLDALPRQKANDIDKANDFLKKSGIDLDACAVFGNYKDSRPIILFALSDKSQFIASIEKDGYKETNFDGDAKLYKKKVYEGSSSEYDDYGYLLIKDDYAYWIERVWVGSDFKPASHLANVVEDAAKHNFADTNFGDYILDGNAGGIAFALPKELRRELRNNGVPSDLADLYSGYVYMRGELEKDKATVKVQLFDEKGEKFDCDKFKDYLDLSANVSKDALALLDKNEFMIFAMSAKNVNWDKYTDLIAQSSGLSRGDRAQLSAVTAYLEKIDGTVAMGFGINNGLKSIGSIAYQTDDMMSAFSTTMVIETKEGKAKRLIDDMKGLLEKVRVPFSDNAAGFTIELQNITGKPGAFYVKNVGNFIVIANHPIKESNDNPLVKSSNLDEYLSVFCAGLSPDNQLMRDLNLKNNIKFIMGCKPNTSEAVMTLEVDGDTDAGIISKVAKMIFKISEQSKNIEEKLESMNPNPYVNSYYDDADTLAYDDDMVEVDSCATEDYDYDAAY